MNDRKEKLLEKIRRVNDRMSNPNGIIQPSISDIVDILQEMNEVFKVDRVSRNNTLLYNNVYTAIYTEVTKIVEKNERLNQFIISDEGVHKAFNLLYLSCINGRLLSPSEDLMKKNQILLINDMFQYYYNLLNPHNRIVDFSITKEEYEKLCDRYNILKQVYSSISEKNNNPIIIIDIMFDAISKKVPYNKERVLR